MSKRLSGIIRTKVKQKADYLTFLKKGLTWKYIQPRTAALIRRQA